MKNIIFLIFVSTIATTFQVTGQNDSIVIKGFIKDTLNGEKLVLTEICAGNIVNSNIECKYLAQSDLKGFFKLKMSKSDFLKKEYKLFIHSVGYEIKPVIINRQMAKDTITIYGRPGVELLGEPPTEIQSPLIEK